MKLIANYSEARLDGKRSYRLTAEKIDVSGNQNFSSNFEVSVPLNTLNPSCNRLWIRHPLFFWMAVTVTVCIVAILFFNFPGSGIVSSSIIGQLSAFTIAMSAAMIATCRKVEFAQFVNKEGVPMVIIAKSGPEYKKFDSFVEAVAEQINIASNMKSNV